MSDIVKETQQVARLIQSSSHSMDLKRYLGKRLPLRYPNKGLRYMVQKGAIVEVYHEQFDPTAFLKSSTGQTVESVIDYYGSTHQRDYCLIILGHRFEGRQTVQFRGVLGKNRLYKILLMLHLAGVPASQIVFHDNMPDYNAIVANDMGSLGGTFDYVVFGGDVIVKPFLSSRFTLLSSSRGEIVSWSIFQHRENKVLLTSYPYGDLSEYVVRILGPMIGKTIIFIGSAGALTTDFPIGTIILPANIYDSTSLITSSFPNYLLGKIEKIGARISGKHLSVKTPLVETTDMLLMLRNQSYESIDVEAAYFQRGCEKYLAGRTTVGVMLFISDQPGSNLDFSKHDYSSEKNLNIRQHFAQILESILEDTI